MNVSVNPDISVEIGETERCGLLDNHQCSIYNSRPIICRTHGMPLLNTDENGDVVLRRDFEIRHASAVLRGDEMLAYCEFRGIEERRFLLDLLRWLAAQYAAFQRRRIEEAGNGEPVFVGVFQN